MILIHNDLPLLLRLEGRGVRALSVCWSMHIIILLIIVVLTSFFWWQLKFSTNNAFTGVVGASRSYTERLQTTILQVSQFSGKSRATTFFLKIFSALRATGHYILKYIVKNFSALRAARSRLQADKLSARLQTADYKLLYLSLIHI